MIPSLDVILFFLFGAIAVGSSLAVVTSHNPMHSVLLLIVSFAALAGLYIGLDSPFTAVTQIIVYAGAIMVLFVFVVMMLNLGPAIAEQERKWLKPGVWIGPGVLSAVLLVELLLVLSRNPSGAGIGHTIVDAKAVGIALFGPYLLVVELASMLLLAALVAAYHLGRHDAKE